jgi:hypothetical protein
MIKCTKMHDPKSLRWLWSVSCLKGFNFNYATTLTLTNNMLLSVIMVTK